MKTPVALFIFNRPSHTARVLNAIASARPARLLIVADGPRAGRLDDPRLCQAARAASEAIDWPCEVIRQYSEVNLGCKRRIASGLDWVFSQSAEAIILEDDCLPDASFFPFCEELLARYREDERVHMIGGTNTLMGRRFGPESYYFSRPYRIWGWASWARAWKHYDVTMRRWPELRDAGWLEKILPSAPMAKLAHHLFEETHSGRVDNWDYQWALAGWLHDACSIVPASNLVANIGYDAAATHDPSPDHPLANLPIAPMAFPLKHPATVRLHEEADMAEWALHHPALARQDPMRIRAQRRLRQLLRWLRTGA